MHHPVVDHYEVFDQIGNTRALKRFEYHDGYYDGAEREQRGFAQVDMYDNEPLQASVLGPAATLSAPPSLIRTWFHLGVEMTQSLAPIDTYRGRYSAPAAPSAHHRWHGSTDRGSVTRRSGGDLTVGYFVHFGK